MTWLIHHWIWLSTGGGGLGAIWPLQRLYRLFRVRRLIVKGDSWKFSYRRRKNRH
jgi:hypothetical protein